MNDQESVPVYAVMRSRSYVYSIEEKNSAVFRQKLLSGHRIILEGTYDQCQNYKTKGQLFKERNGFSKTFKRNMKKMGLDPTKPEDLAVYRGQRNEKRKKRVMARQNKRFETRIQRSSKKQASVKPKK